MTVRPADTHPERIEPERTTTETVRVGDMVRWGGLLVQISDVTSVEGDVQVLLERFDRDAALPISIPINDLDGAEIWYFAGTYSAPMSSAV